MTIDWNAFTPEAALAGGVLIGLAAVLFALFNGRIAGISGIVGGLLKPERGDVAWRIAFLAGLVGAPALYKLAAGGWPDVHIDAGLGRLLIGGLLVGIGTRYGSGCTSGHGVCGLSQRSPRSLVATLVFMGVGFATVYFARHLAGA
jgi:uncharacterized membrane protein YedE/YeeE